MTLRSGTPAWRTALCSLVLCYAMPNVAPAQAWRVLGIEPLPNGHAGQAAHDVARLLGDGTLTSHPAWTQRATAGWHRLTPVRVELELDEALSSAPVVVRVHAIHYPRAGVIAPRRIDVYRGTSVRQMYYVGTLSLAENSAAPSHTSQWFEATVARPGARLALVMHAQRTSMYIDEVEIHAAIAPVSASPADVHAIGDPRADSILRLKRQVGRDPCELVQPRDDTRQLPQLSAWLADALGPLPATRPALESDRSTMVVSGIEGTTEYVALGLYSTADTRIAVSSAVDGFSALRWYRARRVMDSQGGFSFDALLPITDLSDLAVETGCATYLVAGMTFGATGRQRAELELRSSLGATTALAVEGTSHAAPARVPQISVNPFLVVSQAAQLGRPRQVMESAFADGVNTVLIPRHHLPQPGTTQEEQRAGIRRLREDLALVREDTHVVLGLGWQPHVAPQFLREASSSRQQARLKTWLDALSAELQRAGIGKDRWALQLMDEPAPGEIEWVARLLRLLHEVEPGVRKYITLATVPPPSAAESFLRAIQDTATILQIRADAALQLRRPLQRLTSEWWIYSVPAEPAKGSSPVADYTLPAWLGWAMGARGTGVWGYADTRGSSAWDDFDGITSDWSLAYEVAAGPPLPSRRWLGFLRGASDLRVLTALSSVAEKEPPCASALQSIRTAVLDLRVSGLREPPHEAALARQIQSWRTLVFSNCATRGNH